METSNCILNMFLLIDLSIILLNTPLGTYSDSNESKCTGVFLPINNETQFVSLLCMLSIFMTYPPSFIIGNLSLE